jgi:hypothetical protein
MKRWGAEETHHYLMGVFDNLDLAKQVAEENRQDRGGKYEWVIEKWSLNNKFPRASSKVIARSQEMGSQTEEEWQLCKDNDELWSKHYERMNKKQQKERMYQLKKEVEWYREENLKLHKELNERKQV